MSRRSSPSFEQPSLVPLADMLTNTVGILLFILIFVTISSGGAVISKHLPREKPTKAKPIWMYCSGGRIVQFEPGELGKRLMNRLRKPTFETAGQWARQFSAETLETDELEVSGQASANYTGNFFSRSVKLDIAVQVRRRDGRGEDAQAIRRSASEFHRLLAGKNVNDDFLFFFVDPDSIALFRAARDQAAVAGYGVGWMPVGPGAPAQIALSGQGSDARIQ